MYALAMETANKFPVIELPPPRYRDMLPLKESFMGKRNEKSFSPDMLPRQTLSDLLHAATGRSEGEEPEALTAHEIGIYVVLAQGVYAYKRGQNKLTPVIRGDFRRHVAAPALARGGDTAPVRLVYVADLDALTEIENAHADGKLDPETAKCYSMADCGLVAGQVATFAGAAGLNAWFHECDRMALAKILPLRAGKRVLFGHTIGYPG